MSDITTKVSVASEAIYPHLVKPDVRFNELGEYKVTLKVSKSDATDMVKSLDQAIVDSLAKAEKDNKRPNEEGQQMKKGESTNTKRSKKGKTKNEKR